MDRSLTPRPLSTWVKSFGVKVFLFYHPISIYMQVFFLDHSRRKNNPLGSISILPSNDLFNQLDPTPHMKDIFHSILRQDL